MNKVIDNITTEEVPVLITGGGISGLCAALFLLEQGIRPVLIERHKTTSVHPRARGFDVRTMELFRELHLSSAIRDAGKALAPAWGIHTASSMAALLENRRSKKKIVTPAQRLGLEELTNQSPEINARCTQDISEPILYEAGIARGADIRFYTELVSFSQDENYVTAVVKDRQSGQPSVIKARYMIAADGAKSNIREALQLPTVGKGALGNLLNIYFEAHLKQYVEGKEFSILRIDEPGCRGMITSINNSDKWVFHLSYEPGKGELPEDFTTERILTILRKVVGFPEVNIRIISVLPWQPTVKTVTNMRHERIFLAGDAAHVMTPYGGKGANSGVQDVHNLAWRLALVIKNKAAEEILNSYSEERQPVGRHNADSSGRWANEYGLIKKVSFKMIYAFLSVMILSILKLTKFFPGFPMLKLGELMGFPNIKYHRPGQKNNIYTTVSGLKGEPGTRCPHLWVGYNGNTISTLDLLGKDFVLFTGNDDHSWRLAASELSKKYDVNISVYSIGSKADLITGNSSGKTFGIAGNGAVFVRPDGYVYERFTELPPSVTVALEKALLSVLGRG